jgi:hypothetical protein
MADGEVLSRLAVLQGRRIRLQHNNIPATRPVRVDATLLGTHAV